MKIEQLHNYKREQKFAKISKNDTHYRYYGNKYDVDMLYHSSNFYSPDFHTIRVSDKSGKAVWDGGSLLFHSDFFGSTFLSETYDSMVLPLVNDTSDSESMQVILVDLQSGLYKAITGRGFYPYTGHFLSFNGIFYGESNGIKCLDFEQGTDYYLFEKLNTEATSVISWTPCFVPGCLLVINRSPENNIALFNTQTSVWVSFGSITFKEADRVSVSCHPSWNSSRIIVDISYFVKNGSGALQMQSTEFYQIDL